jgi:hypothetical protein
MGIVFWRALLRHVKQLVNAPLGRLYLARRIMIWVAGHAAIAGGASFP